MIVDVQALAKRWNLPAPWLGKLVSEVLAEVAGIEGLKKPSTPPALPDFEARAVLARFSHQAAPPVEGEVEELVDALRDRAARLRAAGLNATAGEVEHAAALLERQVAPVPVAVSERLPELRGMFERILCVARSSDQKPVGNIELADRLIKAVVSWGALAEPVGEGSSDEYLNRVYQGAYQPAWERGEFHGAHYDGLRAVAADLPEQRHLAPVPVAALSSDYREPWDMSSEDGSQCFASAILSRLDGVDAADEAGARWLAAYLQANSRPQHFQPAPVPVSERLPGLEDCDEQGRCWVHQPHEACPESPAWELMLAKYASANYEAMCWLPATALPLPSGEVE